MLRSLNEIEDYTIGASDGLIGHVKDGYFDQHDWVIRFLVVDTGNWLTSRKVLISPFAIGQPDWDGRRLPVMLTRQQVKDSPPLDEDGPLTRQQEMRTFGDLMIWSPGAPKHTTPAGVASSPWRRSGFHCQQGHRGQRDLKR